MLQKKVIKQFIIRSPIEVNDWASKPLNKRMKTWHFKMYNSRDVAFGASAAYVWDAAKVNLPNSKTSLAMSVYPVESVGADKWNRATEYLKKINRIFFCKMVSVSVGRCC
ncbi:MAG: hypothetical protein WDM71_06960 [Ferruginibacter sp.]